MMMPSRGLRWSGHLFHTGIRRPEVALGLGRRFPTGAPLSSIACSPTPRTPCSPYKYPAKSSFLPLTAARFASTTPNGTLTIPISPPVGDSRPTDSIAGSPGELTPATLDDVLKSDLPPITEHIGYLKELGLDYGWGPTAFIETILEHVHVYTGTPWWASILLTALVVRLALLKAYIGASDTSARMAVLTPHIEPIKKRMDAAKASKDQQAMLMVQQEMIGTYRAAGVKMWKLAVPLIQVPLGYGTFRLMRGMAYLPVPGLENGGFLWIKDLTVADPFFLLPVLTSAAYFYTFKKGGELGAGSTMAPAMRSFMQYGIPIMSGAFMLFWPGCMQLSFFFTSLISLSQAWLLRQNWMRSRLGIQPLPVKPATPDGGSGPYTGTMNVYQPPSSAPAPEKKGILGGAISDIKSTASQVARKARKIADQQPKSTKRRTAADLRQAKAYEDRRRKELEKEKADIELERYERQRRGTRGKHRHS